jgi:hypothetical protein
MNQERENIPMAGALSPFERIRRINSAGVEYWSSRDFALVLSYSDYRVGGQVYNLAHYGVLKQNTGAAVNSETIYHIPPHRAFYKYWPYQEDASLVSCLRSLLLLSCSAR